MKNFTTKFSCDKCKIRNRGVIFPERLHNQDLKEWMENLLATVRTHHKRLSPKCTAIDLQDITIPISNGKPGITDNGKEQWISMVSTKRKTTSPSHLPLEDTDKTATVDEEDFEWAKNFKWKLNQNGQVVSVENENFYLCNGVYANHHMGGWTNHYKLGRLRS